MARKIYSRKPRNAGQVITNALGTTVKDTANLFKGMRGIVVVKPSKRHFLDKAKKRPAMFGLLYKRKRK